MTSAAEIPAHVAPRGRAAPITREQVFAAAWDLTRKGQRPSIDRIRMKLGDGTPRGSPNTVNAFLNDWWGQLALRLEERPGAALPFLPERVSGALEVLWNEALAAAKESWQQEWASREEQLHKEGQTLDRRAAELTQRERAIEARGHGLEEALTLARDQLAAANARAETLEATAKRRNAEIDALRKQCSALENENRQLHSQFERGQLDLARRLDAQEARWMREVREARALAKERAKETKRLAAAIEAARRDRDRLTHELARAKSLRQVAAARRSRRSPAGKLRSTAKKAPTKSP